MLVVVEALRRRSFRWSNPSASIATPEVIAGSGNRTTSPCGPWPTIVAQTITSSAPESSTRPIWFGTEANCESPAGTSKSWGPGARVRPLWNCGMWN